MTLRGQIEEFSLPDVFQLLTFSGKSGVVNVHRDDDTTGSVWFKSGDIYFASSTATRKPIGERLLAGGHIDQATLDRALATWKSEPNGGRRIGQILMDMGALTHEVLESYVRQQIADTIFDLMMWDSGDFEYDASPELIEEDIGLAVSVESAVTEGSRRIEEWNAVHAAIPTSAVVLQMCANPTGAAEISLKPMEWQVLAFVDGVRSVGEIARMCGRTEYEVARILFGPLDAGLLEVLSTGAEQQPEPRAAEEPLPATEARDVTSALADETAGAASPATSSEPVFIPGDVEADERIGGGSSVLDAAAAHEGAAQIPAAMDSPLHAVPTRAISAERILVRREQQLDGRTLESLLAGIQAI